VYYNITKRVKTSKF